MHRQAVWFVCAANECVEFPGHSKHAPALAAPAVPEYLPAPQALHALAPAAGWKKPAAHGVHAAAPAPEKKPAAHAAHAAEPAAALKKPAAHAVQGAPSGPLQPAAHEQFRRAPDAAGELEPAGHAWQSGLPLSDHVPAGQRRQASAPAAPAAEYSPAPHREHS